LKDGLDVSLLIVVPCCYPINLSKMDWMFPCS
jgi:hypothetical protein